MQSLIEEYFSASQFKIKKFPIDCSTPQFFMKIQNECEYAYLLESMTGPRKIAQFSFIGLNPNLVISAKENNVILKNMETNSQFKIEAADPLLVLEKILGRKNTDRRFRFVGGAVGYISYDAIHYWENLSTKAKDDLKFPDIQMGIYNDGLILDHIQGETYYFYWNINRYNELVEMISKPYNLQKLAITPPNLNIKKKNYEELVDKAKVYIKSGDIFQVVLSKRYNFEVDGDLMNFYLSLRRINPSPYMYFLKMGGRRIIGSSPEMLMRVDGNLVETFPIAGTRPIVKDKNKNMALAKDLLSDPKERAEHIMLVDLARNDVSKVSSFGSVHVPEFMQVHQYSHVQHIVSRVVGKLREDCNSYDAFRATFPAGTVTGAPKIRAMEIIEELEPTKRGPYAGAVGYFSYNGNADFAITIRTLVSEGKRCFIQAGGGIVSDSIPNREWFETEHKAQALLKALKLSEG